jgi:thioredoxin 1
MPVTQVTTEEEFDNTLLNTECDFVFVDFYADWCGPCKRIAPKLEKISNEYTNVEFIKVNVDELESVSVRYAVRAMPTFIVFNKGSLKNNLDPVAGASEENIRNLLTRATKSVQVTEDF